MKNHSEIKYVAKKNMLALIMYNFFFILVGIYVLLSKIYENNIIFKYTMGGILGGFILSFLFISIFYKSEIAIKYDNLFKKINKVFVYIYLGFTGVFIILKGLKTGLKYKINDNLYFISILIIGIILLLISLTMTIINTFIIIKYNSNQFINEINENEISEK